jgi:hypothetical protein
MNYKIISFDSSNGSIVIKFSENMSPVSVDLPLNENGLYITGEELDEYLKGFIPTWHIERLARIQAGVANASDIEALVETEPEETTAQEILTEQDIANAQMWGQIEFEKQLGAALVKFGLLESNPSTIPVANI